MITTSRLPLPFEPIEAAAASALGLLADEDLAGIALALQERGFDSPALRRLAASTPADADVVGVWRHSLRELGVTQFDDQQAAAEWYVQYMAKRIASRNLSPIEGARAIWRVSLARDPASLRSADPFIYAASEWEDRPIDRRHFEAEIIAEAERMAGVRPRA